MLVLARHRPREAGKVLLNAAAGCGTACGWVVIAEVAVEHRKACVGCTVLFKLGVRRLLVLAGIRVPDAGWVLLSGTKSCATVNGKTSIAGASEALCELCTGCVILLALVLLLLGTPY